MGVVFKGSGFYSTDGKDLVQAGKSAPARIPAERANRTHPRRLEQTRRVRSEFVWLFVQEGVVHHMTDPVNVGVFGGSGFYSLAG